jgi:hypothetical protein
LYDCERDTVHFVDMIEDGWIMNKQKLSIDTLPQLKSEYNTALLTIKIKIDDTNYLPYTIMDNYQQLIHNFTT